MGVQLLVPKLTPAQTFRALAAGAVVGAVLLPWFTAAWQFAFAAALVAATVAALVQPLRYVALVLTGVCVLLLRGAFSLPPPAPTVFIGEQTFEAVVAQPPRPAERVTRYVVAPVGLKVGSVLLVAQPYPRFQFGERVRVTCRVAEQQFASYRNRGIFRECAFPKLASVAPPQPSVRGWLFTLRDAAGARLKQQLHEPYGSLTTGMLWGDDAELPRSLVESFRRTGTSHLLAVSGYNVMVLTELLFAVLVAVGLWRRSASVAVLAAVALFVVFTGAEPAVVRAGIMGSLLVLARLVGRRADRLNLLLGAAAAMVLADPTLIRELGFQLSFAAMAGLMYLSPRLAESFAFVPRLAGLREAVAQTVAATITTTPVVLVWLGQLPLLGIPANVLVGPVVVLVFVLGLPLLVLGAIWPTLAAPFALALTAVLWYVAQVAHTLATVPWAQVLLPAPFTWVAAASILAGAAWWVYRSQTKLV